MVASVLWKTGRVSSRLLAVRKICSTIQSCLYFRATSAAGSAVYGAQHPHSVETLLLPGLFAVDGQGTLAGLEITPVPLVGDQALGAAAQLALKRGEQLRPSGRILGGLFRIAETT